MVRTLRGSLRAGARSLRNRALGKGQVLKQDIQTSVLFIEELLHPPAEDKVLRVTSRKESAQGSNEQAKQEPLSALASEHKTIPTLKRPRDIRGC